MASNYTFYLQCECGYTQGTYVDHPMEGVAVTAICEKCKEHIAYNYIPNKYEYRRKLIDA